MFVLLVGAMLFAQGFGPAPQPAPINVRTEVTVSAPPPDPQAIADASTQSFQAIIVQLVAPTLVSWVNDLLNVPDFIRTTPPDLSYNQPAVRGLSEQVKLVAFALMALAIFCAGLKHSLTREADYGRLAFAAVMIAGELIFWQIGIDLNNGITNGIAAQPIREIIGPHLTLPTLTQDPIAAFGPAVLVIVYAVVALLLMISMAFRLGMIDILIAVGPWAMLCSATEESSSWSQTYWRLAVGTLFGQVLVVVALRLAPILGALGGGIAGTLLGIVVLLLARQMPQMLASQGTRQGSGIGRMILMRLILRR